LRRGSPLGGGVSGVPKALIPFLGNLGLMKVGYAQFKPTLGRKERNLKKMTDLVKTAARMDAELLVFPELCTTGYAFRSVAETRSLCEKIPGGPSTRRMMELSQEHNLGIVGGVAELAGGACYNSAVLVVDGELLGRYRKAHLFHREKRWFRAGNSPFQVYNIDGAKIGITICFDWAFPECIRVLALKGADIICQPANLLLPYCQKAMLGAAVQNRVFIVTANRTGFERGLRFTGRSQIVSPSMRILARSSTREEVRVAQLNLDEARNKKLNEYNDLILDRRPELYTELVRHS